MSLDCCAAVNCLAGVLGRKNWSIGEKDFWGRAYGCTYTRVHKRWRLLCPMLTPLQKSGTSQVMLVSIYPWLAVMETILGPNCMYSSLRLAQLLLLLSVKSSSNTDPCWVPGIPPFFEGHNWALGGKLTVLDPLYPKIGIYLCCWGWDIWQILFALASNTTQRLGVLDPPIDLHHYLILKEGIYITVISAEVVPRDGIHSSHQILYFLMVLEWESNGREIWRHVWSIGLEKTHCKDEAAACMIQYAP